MKRPSDADWVIFDERAFPMTADPYGFIGGTLALGAGATLTVALYVYAKEQGEFEVAFAIAAILMILTLLINLAAALVERYFKRKKSL